MADKEVITALELCANISQDGCMMLCPYKDDRDETYSGLCEHIMKQDALELLKDQQAEIERLKEEKERAIRDIDLYIADAESDAKTPPRTGKGYSVGLGYGLLIAKEILQGIRNHG